MVRSFSGPGRVPGRPLTPLSAAQQRRGSSSPPGRPVTTPHGLLYLTSSGRLVDGNISRGKILVLDDSAATLALLTSFFEAEEYDVAEANAGESTFDDCLKVYSETRPDLVLINVSGQRQQAKAFDLAAHIKGADPLVKVILVLENESFLTDFVACQTDRLILRQPPLDVLLEHVDNLLDLQRSERKQRRVEAIAQEHERLASLGRAVAGVAHDTNNLLCHPIALLDMVVHKVSEVRSAWQKMLGPKVPLPEALTAIEEDLGAVGTSLNDLVVFMRKVLGFVRHNAEIDTFVPNEAIEEAVFHASVGQRSSGVLISTILCKEAAFLHGDKQKLMHAIYNLIKNAQDAMESGGKISVRSRFGSRNDFIIEVTDNGPGIQPEALSRIFDEFFTTKPEGVGTGLGLSMAKATIEEMGGRIDVLTQLGKGTTFSIALPLRRKPGR